jgi:hypothetical protein
MTSEDFMKNLAQFLGAYFHQDWSLESTDAEGVLRSFMRNEPQETVRQVCDEIEQLLKRDLSDEELGSIVHGELGSYYSPAADGMTYRQWLHWIQTYLRRST